MLRDVRPKPERRVEWSFVKNAPEDDGDEEGIGGYAGPEEVVEGLQGAGEAVEKWCAAVEGVGEGVD